MTENPNVKLPSHLHYQTLVIQVLYPLLRHLNAGTISVVLMIALALVDAVRDTESASRGPAVDNATMVGMASDGSRVWFKTSRLPGVQEFTCFRQPDPRPKRLPVRCRRLVMTSGASLTRSILRKRRSTESRPDAICQAPPSLLLSCALN